MSIKLLFLKTIHSTACLVKNLMEVLQYLLTIQFHTVISNLILACRPSQSEPHHRTISVCSIYLSPSAKFTSNDLDDLLSQLPPPVLLLGDFNAHSRAYFMG